MSETAWSAAGLALLMAVWWATEAIPIPATSLLLILLIPILGIGTLGSATSPYANSVIFLFLGGFVIGLAMQRWNLHRRIALHLLLAMRSEEHTSELQSLIRSSYAVFSLKKKSTYTNIESSLP